MSELEHLRRRIADLERVQEQLVARLDRAAEDRGKIEQHLADRNDALDAAMQNGMTLVEEMRQLKAKLEQANDRIVRLHDRVVTAEKDHKSLDQLADEQGVGPVGLEELERLAGALPDLPPPRPRDEVSAKLKAKLAKARTAITDACNLLGTITCVPAVVRKVSQLEQTLREIGDD